MSAHKIPTAEIISFPAPVRPIRGRRKQKGQTPTTNYYRLGFDVADALDDVMARRKSAMCVLDAIKGLFEREDMWEAFWKGVTIHQKARALSGGGEAG